MHEWRRQVQTIVDAIDESIANRDDEALALRALAERLGYSEFHTTRKFKEVSGMPLRDYLRTRRLAFALKEVRDGDKALLDIALDHGFSSHEAFTRAFKGAFGTTPSAYRKDPRPVVLRTKITAFDRYVFGMGEIGMEKTDDGIEQYLITVPAHRFLHVRNCESNGYWDFWQKQAAIPGQDRDTVCGLLDSVKGKLDDEGGPEANAGGGQVMAYVSDPEGRLCAWGFPRVECHGARLPADWEGEVPPNLQLMDVAAGEYAVFEHGPFDYERQMRTMEDEIEAAMSAFEAADNGWVFDTTPGKVIYLYFDPARFCKYVRPVRKAQATARTRSLACADAAIRGARIGAGRFYSPRPSTQRRTSPSLARLARRRPGFHDVAGEQHACRTASVPPMPLPPDVAKGTTVLPEKS